MFHVDLLVILTTRGVIFDKGDINWLFFEALLTMNLKICLFYGFRIRVILLHDTDLMTFDDADMQIFKRTSFHGFSSLHVIIFKVA